MSDHRTQAAKCLGKVEKELQGFLSEAARAGDYPAVVDLGRAAEQVAQVARTLAGTNGMKTRAGAAAMNKPAPAYPRFFREGDRLVLVGRQRKKAGEYDHRCPKADLDRLVAALLRSPITPKTREQLQQIQPPGSPEYLVSTCLRWLLHVGLVKKHGHKGYEVLDPQHFKANVATHWNQLPTLSRHR